MINIVLFNDESIVRIAEKAVSIFSSFDGFRTSRDAIWLNGIYLRFTPRLISLNSYGFNNHIDKDVYSGLKEMLHGEEVWLSDEKQRGRYYKNVDASTDFDSVFTI